MRLRATLLAILAAAAVPACPGLDDGPTPTKTSWTVMVYLLADNDLEPAGLTDLEEMMAVGSGDRLAIVAQVDRAAGEAAGDVGGIYDWSGAKRVRVRPGSLEELQDLGETNMADPATLADFIKWAVRTAPADRYMLVLWDHGGAWPQYGVDYSHGKVGLDLKQLKAGISQGLADSGVPNFSILGFDACLMATYETGIALKDYSELLLASEETEPGHGWDYRSLQAVVDQPDLAAADLGQRIMDGYRAQAIAEKNGDVITLSLLDLTKMSALGRAVDKLAAALNTPDLATKAGQTRQQTVEFAKNPDPSRSTNMIDLGDFASRMAAAGGATSTAASGIQAALADLVVGNVTGSAYRKAKGLSIYFPPMKNLYDAKYDQLEGIAGWRSFLKGYFGSVAGGVAPTFTNANHTGTVSANAGQLTLTGQLAAGAAAGIVDAQLAFGIVDDATSSVIVVGDAPASVDAAGLVSGTWNLSVLGASQGGNSDYAYLSLSPTNDGGYLMMVPFGYQESGQSQAQIVYMLLLLDAAGTEKSRTFYAQAGEAWGELTPAAGSSVATILQVIDANDNVSWSYANAVAMNPTQPIDFQFLSLNPGVKVFMMLTVSDAAGQSDYVLGGGTL